MNKALLVAAAVLGIVLSTALLGVAGFLVAVGVVAIAVAVATSPPSAVQACAAPVLTVSVGAPPPPAPWYRRAWFAAPRPRPAVVELNVRQPSFLGRLFSPAAHQPSMPTRSRFAGWSNAFTSVPASTHSVIRPHTTSLHPTIVPGRPASGGPQPPQVRIVRGAPPRHR